MRRNRRTSAEQVAHERELWAHDLAKSEDEGNDELVASLKRIGQSQGYIREPTGTDNLNQAIRDARGQSGPRLELHTKPKPKDDEDA
jgi:hypothetical protein